MRTALHSRRGVPCPLAWSAALALLSAGCVSPAGGARREPAGAPSPAAALQPQQEDDDGAWVLPWLLDRWGLQAPAPELAAGFERCLASGYTPEEGLLTILPRAGLWTRAQLGDWSELKQQLGHGCPVLVQTLSGTGRRRTRQFLIVTAASAAGDRVTGRLADGVAYDRDAGEFLSRWRLTRFWMLTACPPERAQWNMGTSERMSLARHYEQTGRADLAEIEARRALASDPANPDLLNDHGVRALKRGETDEAERFFRLALGGDSRHVRSLNNLAFLLAESGRSVEEAAALARRALLLEPTNPRALDTHALVLMRQEQWADARTQLERAWIGARGLPVADRIEIGLRLARAYTRLGERALACRTVGALRALEAGLAVPEELRNACAEP